MNFETIQRFFRENPRALILGGLSLLAAGAFAIWIFSGAGVEVGQFFAAEPASVDFTGRNPTPTELRMYSAAQGWSEDFQRFSDPVLQGWIDCCWNISAKKFNSRRAGVNGFWEKPTECPAGQVPSGPNETDPCISAPSSSSGSGSPAQPSAPTAGPPVFCSPQTQTIAPGASARVDATGGTGTYTWTASGGAVQESGGSNFAAYSWTTAGTKQVVAGSGSQFAFCNVIVRVATATATPTATPGGTSPIASGVLSVQKQASVTEVRAGEAIQFTIIIRSTATIRLDGLRARDEVPAGMSYQSGSTVVDGVPYPADNSIVSGGLALEGIDPGQTMYVTWNAVADRTNTLPAGIHTSPTTVFVTARNQQAQASVSIVVISTGAGIAGTPVASPTTGVGAGTVATGPGDAVVMALAAAAAAAFLYTAYTRSPTFRRREVDQIGKNRDPLDFRS